MVFSDTTNKNGIVQMCEQITSIGDGNISGNTVKLAYFTTLINNWLNMVSLWIHEVQGEWPYDDQNHGDFPEEVFDFVDNQQDYGLSTSGEINGWTLKKVEVRDATTLDYSTLNFVYSKDIPENYDGSDKGKPIGFWLSGGSIIFNCPVDVAKADKYRLTYDRQAHPFTVSDTTAEPGFNSDFHIILAYGPSMEYALSIGDTAVYNQCQKMIYGTDPGRDIGLKRMLQKFYSNRLENPEPKINKTYAYWK